jgi:hypothetical protein
VSHLRQQGFSDSLVLWMASNLISQGPGKPGKPPQPLVWAFDVKGAVELYEDYKKVDSWNVMCAPPHTLLLCCAAMPQCIDH